MPNQLDAFDASPSWGDSTATSSELTDERVRLTAERARLAAEQADKLAMENAIRRGEVAPMEYYEERLRGVIAPLAAGLDALPPRIKTLLPHLTHRDYARLERLFAEFRAGLAGGLSGSEPDGSGDRGAHARSTAHASTAKAQ